MSLVAISGNVRVPSRTAALVRLIQARVESRLGLQGTFISLTDVAPSVMTALTPAQLSPAGIDVLRRVEAADILVIGSPIYRASYTGALKHLFDLVDNRSLIGAVAVLAATGGTPLHGLALEHQFRPLFGYFGIVAAATTIYALESDFSGEQVADASVHERAARAAEEVALLAQAGLRQRRAQTAAAA
jgi:FMN reductase